VSKRISSSDWTGPEELSARSGAFTYGAGQHSISTDYQRILAAERAAAAVPPEVQRIKRWALLVLVSPILLWLGWHFVAAVTRDAMGSNQGHVLILWGLGIAAFAAWQSQSDSKILIGLRRGALMVAFGASVLLAIAYCFVAIDAHANAVAMAPERTFELYKVHGRRPFRHVEAWHQRVNGTNFENGRKGHPLAYATACALVQRLNGPHGFSWVRVVERSRPPARGQLHWGIRRDECFSTIPLSSLPR